MVGSPMKMAGRGGGICFLLHNHIMYENGDRGGDRSDYLAGV